MSTVVLSQLVNSWDLMHKTCQYTIPTMNWKHNFRLLTLTSCMRVYWLRGGVAVQDLTKAVVVDVHQVWLRTPLGPRNQGLDDRQEAGGISGPSASSPFLNGPTVELMRKHTLDSWPNYVSVLTCAQTNMVRTVRRTILRFFTDL